MSLLLYNGQWLSLYCQPTHVPPYWVTSGDFAMVDGALGFEHIQVQSNAFNGQEWEEIEISVTRTYMTEEWSKRIFFLWSGE